MTSPSAQPQTTPPRQAQASAAPVIAAVAVVLASGMPPTAIASAAIPLLAMLGIHPAASVKALSLVVPHDLPPVQIPGPVEQRAAIHEALFRARYLVNAADRFKDPAHSMAQERVYAQQHLGAQRARAEAAAKIDKAVERHGPELGWYAVLDDATTKDCRAANGSNFSALDPPKIGLPGSVHPACRCKSGPPHANAKTVDQATAHLFAPSLPDVIPFPVQLSNPLRDKFDLVHRVLSRSQD